MGEQNEDPGKSNASDSESESSWPPVWSGGRPDTFTELFKFYHDYVKVLYADVQVENQLPQELLFELNAALDHISRRWSYNEEEAQVVRRAYSHMKRACLDVFKIRLKRTADQYKDLQRCDVSVIDNGTFEKGMKALFADIRVAARGARREEGVSDSNSNVPAFEAWSEVFVLCTQFEERFFDCPHVSWAKKRGFWAFVRNNFWGLIIGALGSFLATALWVCFFGS